MTISKHKNDFVTQIILAEALISGQLLACEQALCLGKKNSDQRPVHRLDNCALQN